MLKKLLIYTVAVSTICWSIGLVALVPAVQAVGAGSLVKLPGSSAVYYVGSDGKKYTFTDSATYNTWYSDFSSVQEVSDLSSYDTGGNVTAKPGAIIQEVTMDEPWLIASDKVFAVDADGLLHWVTTADVAVELYGADWATKIQAVPSGYISSYTVGDELTAAADYDKAAAVAAATSINVDKGLGEDPTVSDDPVVVAGEFNVSVASDTPATDDIPQQAQGVEYMKFNIKATDGDVTVTEVVLRRTGPGFASDFGNVYLYDGIYRLTSGRSLATDTHTVTVPNLSVKVKDGQTKTLTVKTDVSSTASTGSKSRIEVYSVNGTSISGVYGNYMSIASVTATTVTVNRTSSSWQVTLGSSDIEVAKFNLNSASQDAYLTGLTLTDTGTLGASYLKNFKLMLSDTEIASADAMTGDKVVFNFPSAYLLPKSLTKNFVVKADNTGGRTDRTSVMYIEESSDITLEDAVYGGGAVISFPTTNGYDADNPSTVTYKGGELTVAHNGPVASSYGVNSLDNVLLKFSITANQNVTVKKTQIYIASLLTGTIEAAAATNYSYIKNIEIVDLDKEQTLVGPETTAAALTTTTFDSTYGRNEEFAHAFSIKSGETRHLALRADIDSSYDTAAGNQITARVVLNGTNYIYDDDAAEYLGTTKIVPGELVSNTMSVTSSGLTVAAGSVAVYEVVKGAQDLVLLAPLVTANIADEIKINRVYVRVFADADTTFDSGHGGVAANEVVETVSLYEHTTAGDTLIAGPKNISLNSGTTYAAASNYYRADFSSMNYTIPKGVQKTIYVKVNLKKTLTAQRYIAAEIHVDDDIEAEDSQGSILAAANKTGNPSTLIAVNGNTSVTATTKSYYSTAYTSGTLAVAVNGSNTPVEDVVVSGSDDVEFSQIRFTAAREHMIVTALTLYNDGTSGSLDNNLDIATLSYTDASGSAATQTVSFTGGKATLSTGQVEILCQKDQNSVLTVSANIHTIRDGATSGEAPRISLEKTATQFASGGTLTNNLIVLGASSDETLYGLASALTFDDSNLNPMTVRKTKVTVTSQALPTSYGSVTSQENPAIFKLTSASEAGTNQNSTLGGITIKLAGTAIEAGSAGDATMTLYKGSTFATANLIGTATSTGTTASSRTFTYLNGDDTDEITGNNEWNGDLMLYVVVDTTDGTPFAPSTNETLSASVTTWTWDDGTTEGASSVPVTGFPVAGGGGLTY